LVVVDFADNNPVIAESADEAADMVVADGLITNRLLRFVAARDDRIFNELINF